MAESGSTGELSPESMTSTSGGDGQSDTGQASISSEGPGSAAGTGSEATTAAPTTGVSDPDITSASTGDEVAETGEADTATDTGLDDDVEDVPPSRFVLVQGQGGLPVVFNVDDPAVRFTELDPLVDPTVYGSIFPWSADLRWLSRVDFEENRLVISNLENGEEVVVEFGDALGLQQIGWAGARGALVTWIEDERIVALVTPEGEVFEQLRLEPAENPAGAAMTPDGSAFVYSLVTEAGFSTYALDLSEPSTPSVPVLLVGGSQSPPLYSKAAGSWVALGFSGPADGLAGTFVWSSTQGGSAVKVSPEGSTFAPYFFFSPGADAGLLLYDMFPDAQVSISFVPLDEEIGPLRTLVELTSNSLSPPTWSDSGAYVTYEYAEEGRLQAISASGIEASTLVPGFRYSSPIEWIDSSTFVYSQSGTEGPQLHWKDASDADDPTPMGQDGVELAFAADCLVAATDDAVHLAPPSPTPEWTTIVPETGGLHHIALSTDAERLVWFAGSTVYLQPLAGCRPEGDPMPLLALEQTDVDVLRFLSPPTR